MVRIMVQILSAKTRTKTRTKIVNNPLPSIIIAGFVSRNFMTIEASLNDTNLLRKTALYLPY